MTKIDDLIARRLIEEAAIAVLTEGDGSQGLVLPDKRMTVEEAKRRYVPSKPESRR